MILTRQECSHLVNILSHYITLPDNLEKTVHIIDESETSTSQVLAKLLEGSLSYYPAKLNAGEVDHPSSLMPDLQKIRNLALSQGDFESAVLLSHIHAWLYWASHVLKDAEHARDNQVNQG